MSENQQAPVAQTFTFEKKMGSQVLTFTVSVLLLGETPATPEIPGPHPRFGDDGETFWFVSVKGPFDTGFAYYRSYRASTKVEQVAEFAFIAIGRGSF